MIRVLVKDIRLPITEQSVAATDFAQKKLSALLGKGNVGKLSVYRKSVDARRRDKITAVYSVMAEIDLQASEALTERLAKAGLQTVADDTPVIEKGSARLGGRPLVVGFGPAGMFSALILAENGYRPIVIERGDDTDKRAEKVLDFYRTGQLDTESNIQFGAGGAGTFSDGKLVTRINDPKCRYVLKKLVALGAPEAVLTEAKPHVGTDLLMDVVSNIKNEIERLGGQVLFRTALKNVITDGSGKIIAVGTNAGEIKCGAVILATGHSARDVYGYLKEHGFEISEKPLSVGLRIEHKRRAVEEALFGREMLRKAEQSEEIRKLLGHGEYAYSLRAGERAVYTFCMCPGGEVVAGASEEGGVVCNGMSRHARDGENSNSAVCVSVTPQDCRAFGGTMEFCRALERRAYEMGGGGYAAPVQTVGDFLEGKGRLSPIGDVFPTYMGGNGNVKVARLDTLYPEFITDMLRKGIRRFAGNMKGFDAPGAVLTGAETRTSAPYRIERLESGVSARCENLYPCGEGAGYAGGITSAAVDGISQAMKLMSVYGTP
ncbi:MAG: hypothetical protein IJV70_00310 [Clostridia bacterium]|nr:hypothetical protein [Clostridia bacterium]